MSSSGALHSSCQTQWYSANLSRSKPWNIIWCVALDWTTRGRVCVCVRAGVSSKTLTAESITSRLNEVSVFGGDCWKRGGRAGNGTRLKCVHTNTHLRCSSKHLYTHICGRYGMSQWLWSLANWNFTTYNIQAQRGISQRRRMFIFQTQVGERK